MKNANKAEKSKEAKALSVVAKVEKQSRAKGKPNAATVEAVNGLSGETVGLDVGDRISQFCRLDAAGEIAEAGRLHTKFRSLPPYTLKASTAEAVRRYRNGMPMTDPSEEAPTPGADLNSAIGKLTGRMLSSVEFVQDYLQLRFDGPCLTAYTRPVVNLGPDHIDWGGAGYRDLLCEQIGSTVVDALANEVEVLIRFESGVVVSVSLRDRDYLGPEAIQFTGEDGVAWVS